MGELKEELEVMTREGENLKYREICGNVEGGREVEIITLVPFFSQPGRKGKRR